MTETSKEGFVPRHLRGVDVDEFRHRHTKCQFHTIATDRLAWQAKKLRGEPTKYGPEPAPKPVQGTVYALLSGFNVKVGWTGRDIQDRLREYPPSTTLLVAYPGARSEETRIKRKFSHFATHGSEWFSYDPQVKEWVESMRAKYGEPDAGIECGPAPTYVPRPMANKPLVRPRQWTGKTA